MLVKQTVGYVAIVLIMIRVDSRQPRPIQGSTGSPTLCSMEKAALDVENADLFVLTQGLAAMKQTVANYPYEHDDTGKYFNLFFYGGTTCKPAATQNFWWSIYTVEFWPIFFRYTKSR